MKIIAGFYKNKNLIFVSNFTTRPTANIVREGLFSKIQFHITDSVFLDLFSGSGSIGIEALSRGARKVYFVDHDKKNIEIIKKNIENCKINKNNYEIINNDYCKAIDQINEQLDFVFIDPPYQSNLYEISIEKLIKNNLLTNESIVICEHDTKRQLNFETLNLISTKKYGSRTLSYFVKK